MSHSRVEQKDMPRWLAALLSLVLLAIGIGGAATLIKTKTKPAKEPEAAILPVVEVHTLQVGTRALQLELHGSVQAARQVVLQPEVGGRIVWHDAALVPGGTVRAGQSLVRIDARDYALALRQQRAQVEAQRLNLEIERGRKQIAEKEWSLFQSRRKAMGRPKPAPPEKQSDEKAAKKADEKPPLALREQHLKSAKVALQSAESSVQRAQLSLSRTTLIAPFNAFVQTERVDLGQLVGPQSQIATLVGTDAFWVQVSIPIDKLPYVKLPQGDTLGSHARIWIDTGQGRIERDGRVIRLLGDLDPAGRMARLVVEVQDPFGLKPKTAAESSLAKRSDEMDAGSPTTSTLPLLLGSFVHVEIEGKLLEQVVEIPRRALRSDNTVWLLNAKNELTVKSVRVVWSTSQITIIRGSLATGDRVIVSRLGSAVSGMKLRVISPAPATTTSRRGL